MYTKLKGLVFTGFLVLIPVVVIIVLLVELYEFNLVLVNMLDAIFPNKTFFDVVTANVIAILMILLMFLIVGAAVHISIVSALFDKLEQTLIRHMPGYAMLRSSISSGFSDESGNKISPVVVFNG